MKSIQRHFFVFLTLLNIFVLLLLSTPAAEGQKMYWTDVRGIHRINLHQPQHAETLLSVILSNPRSIAIDANRAKIYWLDSRTRKIHQANLDGTNVEDLLIEGFDEPRGLAVDGTGGKIYWTDIGKIYRANHDGTQVEAIITEVVNAPWSVAIDAGGGKFYWTDAEARKIQRSNLDGSNVEDLVIPNTPLIRMIRPTAIAIDVSKGKVYWSDIDAIYRANLDGMNIEQIAISPVLLPQQIAIDQVSGKMYWIDGDDTIRQANLDGTDVEDVFRGSFVAQHLLGIAVDSSAGKLYWTTFGATPLIQRSNLDGTNVDTLVTAGLLAPWDVDVDVTQGKLYWTEGEEPSIHRANLDGTANEKIVEPPRVGFAASIALDPFSRQLYWTDRDGKRIRRANLDGTNIQDIITTGDRPEDIALDLVGGKIYWTDSGKIQRANLDGTGIEEIFAAELLSPERLAVDGSRGKIYWTERFKIRRSNLDGTDVEDIFMEGDLLIGIAIDPIGRKLYWADTGTSKIQRANLDGTNVEDIVTGVFNPRFIALDLLSSVGVVPVEPKGKRPALWGRVRQNALLQNFPNPFNPETWIPFHLAQDADVTIQIYDLRGQNVRTLSLGRLKAGFYEDRQQAAYWDGRAETGEAVSSGVYFYQFWTGNYSAIRRMVILK